jgi:hypothetical protein
MYALRIPQISICDKKQRAGDKKTVIDFQAARISAAE